MNRRRLALSLAVLSAVALGALEAQRRRGGGMFVEENPPYDGRYTFARVRYEGFNPAWAHDYPRGERHFTKILTELSTVNARTQESSVLSLTDPEIFRHPVLYMSEPGFWQPSDAEVESLRKYLLKGGFMIFDDFDGQRHFYNLQEQLARVLPQGRLVELDLTHPIFDSFYRIKTLDFYTYRGKAVFHGIYEDNDPSKRLLMILNTNNDLSELWEFSDEGIDPIEVSNEAYKYGVNYVIYALTR